jgi:hypothetical protein
MSNLDEHGAAGKNGNPTEPQTWRQRYGAALLLGVFALLGILMIVIQKKMQ